MAWAVLFVSGVLEAVWATALGESEGFSRLGPTVVFLIALTLSMLGLGWSLKHIPIGTAYAVWVGIGAALTVVYAMATGAESVSVLKVVCLVGIILAVMGLKFLPEDAAQQTEGTSEPAGSRATRPR